MIIVEKKLVMKNEQCNEILRWLSHKSFQFPWVYRVKYFGSFFVIYWKMGRKIEQYGYDLIASRALQFISCSFLRVALNPFLSISAQKYHLCLHQFYLNLHDCASSTICSYRVRTQEARISDLRKRFKQEYLTMESHVSVKE